MSLFVSLLIGGFVGWLIARLSRDDRNMAFAVAMGALGAVVAAYLVGLLGLRITVRLEQLVAGIVGAAILVLAVRR